MGDAGAESGVVDDGQGAGRRVSGEVGAQPFLFAGAGLAAANELASRIEDDDVPGPQVEAVVSLVWVAGRGPEVLEVAGGVMGVVLVVADGRPRAVLVAAPRRVIALGELLRCARLIGGIAQKDYRPLVPVEEIGGGLVAA